MRTLTVLFIFIFLPVYGADPCVPDGLDAGEVTKEGDYHVITIGGGIYDRTYKVYFRPLIPNISDNADYFDQTVEIYGSSGAFVRRGNFSHVSGSTFTLLYYPSEWTDTHRFMPIITYATNPTTADIFPEPDPIDLSDPANWVTPPNTASHCTNISLVGKSSTTGKLAEIAPFSLVEDTQSNDCRSITMWLLWSPPGLGSNAGVFHWVSRDNDTNVYTHHASQPGTLSSELPNIACMNGDINEEPGELEELPKNPEQEPDPENPDDYDPDTPYDNTDPSEVVDAINELNDNLVSGQQTREDQLAELIAAVRDNHNYQQYVEGSNELRHQQQIQALIDVEAAIRGLDLSVTVEGGGGGTGEGITQSEIEQAFRDAYGTAQGQDIGDAQGEVLRNVLVGPGSTGSLADKIKESLVGDSTNSLDVQIIEGLLGQEADRAQHADLSGAATVDDFAAGLNTDQNIQTMRDQGGALTGAVSDVYTLDQVSFNTPATHAVNTVIALPYGQSDIPISFPILFSSSTGYGSAMDTMRLILRAMLLLVVTTMVFRLVMRDVREL